LEYWKSGNWITHSLFAKYLILVFGWQKYTHSLVPRPSPAPFSWLHTGPLNHPEKRQKVWYIFYVIKPQGGLGYINYGSMPMRQIAIDSEWHKTTLLLFQFTAMTRRQHLRCPLSIDGW